MRPSPASVIQYKADQAKAAPKEITATYGQLEVLLRMLCGVGVSKAARMSLEPIREQVANHLNTK